MGIAPAHTARRGAAPKHRAMSLGVETIVPSRADEAAAFAWMRPTPSEGDLPGAAESSLKTRKREAASAYQLRTSGLLRRPHIRWQAP